MTFDAAAQIADAVLYEGYVLYPYRASAVKNQYRWQFGIVAPRAPRDDGEPWFAQTDCLVQLHDGDARLKPSRYEDDGGGTGAGLVGQGPTDTAGESEGLQPSAAIALQPNVDVPAVLSDVARRLQPSEPVLGVRVRCLRPTPTSTGWLDGVPHAIDVAQLDLREQPSCEPVSLHDLGLDARLVVEVRDAGALKRVRLRLENLEPWRDEFGRDRDAMLARSLVGAHLLLHVDGGRFVSLLDPPAEAAALAAACENRHAWPVLVGDRARCDLMLSAPIVLEDFPAVAKESQGDLCDAAEIDEILSLRILTMTDEEKLEARATDPRARDILDRVERMSPDALAALHGTVRSADFFNPRGASSPDADVVTIAGRRVARGSHVRLRPQRRSDAMDMFLANQLATVAGVYRDVDDRVYVAVTVDADPAASLHESFGRFFYFDPTEIELMDVEQEPL